MSNNPNGSIGDIEREIDEDRSHLAATLSALENKFSPGQFVDQILGYAKRNGGDFSDNLVKTVANNPLPTILTGIGVTWMALNQGRQGGSYDGAYQHELHGDGSSKMSEVKDKTSGMKGSLSSSAHRAGSKASHAASDARGMVGDLRQSASAMRARRQEQWEHTSQGAREFFEQNPLVVGAAAVAAGALIGSCFRASAKEKEMLGETSEQMKEQAQSLAKEAKDTATEAGKAGMTAAKEKAKQSAQSKSRMETH